MSRPIEVHTIQEASLDHNPVITLIGYSFLGVEAEVPTKKKINWGKFHSRLDPNIRPLPVNEDREEIQAAIQMLEEDF